MCVCVYYVYVLDTRCFCPKVSTLCLFICPWIFGLIRFQPVLCKRTQRATNHQTSQTCVELGQGMFALCTPPPSHVAPVCSPCLCRLPCSESLASLTVQIKHLALQGVLFLFCYSVFLFLCFSCFI